jgi:hypothetical protein
MSKLMIKKLLDPIPVDPNMEDFSNDPYVIAKTEKARKFLVANGTPKSFQNKTKTKKKLKA